MLVRVKLELLKQLVERDDWIIATDLALELSLESKGTLDEFIVEALPLAVRSQDAE